MTRFPISRLAPLAAALALGLLAVTATPAAAQDHGAAPAPAAAAQAPATQAHEATTELPAGAPGVVPGEHGPVSGATECGHHGPDFITPHITDSHCIDYPGFPKFWEVRSAPLPRFAPIHVGGVEIDLSPTKHVVMLLIASLLCCLMLITAARAHAKHHHAVGRPKGFASGIEAMVLFIRNEVAIPNLGHHGAGYAPFILTLFWFILFANLLGLIPFGATATGNISVTAMLAIVTFLVIESAGIRANGVGYLSTIFYWNKDLNIVMRVLMFIIMTPVEIIGKFSKPFALAIRLFANMTAGHIVVLALIGLIFAFKSYTLGTAPLLMAVAIMMLEIFVAFLQAFIFALLASVFIGQIREAHH